MQLVITIGTRVIIFQIYFVEYYVYQICLGFYWVAVKQECNCAYILPLLPLFICWTHLAEIQILAQ